MFYEKAYMYFTLHYGSLLHLLGLLLGIDTAVYRGFVGPVLKLLVLGEGRGGKAEGEAAGGHPAEHIFHGEHGVSFP